MSVLSRGQQELVGRGVIQRQPWFEVACCPPNVMRLLASLGNYVASYDDDGVQIHQYMPGSIRTPLATLRVATDYPWRADVTVKVEATNANAWTLKLRIPAWAASLRLARKRRRHTRARLN